MCGRYYVDDETAREIEKLVRQVDERQRQAAMGMGRPIVAGDIHPSQEAPVLLEEGGALRCRWQRWGFPMKREVTAGRSMGVIFNARSETAMEKPLFRDSIRDGRIVVPGTWFYEWDRGKQKYTFYRKDRPVLFMAGCCRRYGDGMHFVILTTVANASVEAVHDRMPLLLEEGEIGAWLSDSTKTATLLKKAPCLLERKTAYEQLDLFSSKNYRL